MVMPRRLCVVCHDAGLVVCVPTSSLAEWRRGAAGAIKRSGDGPSREWEARVCFKEGKLAVCTFGSAAPDY